MKTSLAFWLAKASAAATVLLVIEAGASAAEISLWVESSGGMILPDRPAGTLQQIDRSGVRNQFVTAQLGLRAGKDVKEPCSFDWTALEASGERIGRENVVLFRGADIVVDHGQKVSESGDKARARAYGSYPDALVPLVDREGRNVANRITLEKDRTLLFWIDVFVPAGTPPGDYRGRIALKSGEDEVAAIPVKISVVNLEIPADSTIPSLFNLRLHKHVADNLDNYVAEVMRHRIQPTNYHYVDYVRDKRFGWAMLDRLNPQGNGYVNVYYYHTGGLAPEKARALLDGLREVTAHLKERKGSRSRSMTSAVLR